VKRISGPALVLLCAIIPLYGTLAALDPSRPPIPKLVPDAVAAGIGLLAVAALIAVVPAAVRVARRDWLTAAFVAPGFASLIAALTGFDPVFGVSLSLLVLGVGGAGLALARDADAATVRACVRGFLISGVAAALLALAMVVLRRPAGIYAYDNGRAVGTFLNPNELAAYTLIALGVAVPLAVASRGRDRLAVAAAIVFAVTLGATFSRWGILSAVCGVAAYALLTRARLLLIGALAVAVAGIGLNALAGARHHNPRDTEARIVAWQAGLTTFARFPLLGVGPIAFGRTYAALRPPEAPGPRTPVAFDPHSLPIAFAAEGGILALVTLTASFAIVFRRIVGAARSSSQLSRALAFGLAAGLVALVVDCGINTIILFFPLGLQVVPLALAASRTDAL
jgi:O-antigen ligase